MHHFIYLIILFLAFSCATPNTESYRQSYQHLKDKPLCYGEMQESDFFLVILVNARHLDYTNTESFCRTVSKHPSDCSKNGDVGHAWIYLQGVAEGKVICLEGGQSGELGVFQPKYCDGIMDNIENGVENPIKYLWAVQQDGFFQEGSGGHAPTFAAKVDLTEDQFWKIMLYIDPGQHCYSKYSLVENQCGTFVADIASIAELKIEHRVTMPISQTLTFRGCEMVLWCDPKYSCITISSPDVIEKSLIEAVLKGRAEYALEWYTGTGHAKF